MHIANKDQEIKEYSILVSGAKQGVLADKDCAMLISLPIVPYFDSWLGSTENEWIKKIKAILGFATKGKLKSLKIILADTAQRFILMSAYNCSEEEALKKIELQSSDFVQFLKNNGVLESNIISWNSLIGSSEYSVHLAEVGEIYENCMEFRNEVNSTALQFLKSASLFDTSVEFISSAMRLYIDYILEGIAVLLVLNYDFIISPILLNKAILKAYEILGKLHRHMPKYQLVKIKPKGSMVVSDLLGSYQDLIKLLPGLVYCKDLEGNCIWSNNNFLENPLGFEDADSDAEVIQTGKVLHEEKYLTNTAGVLAPYLLIKAPVRNKNEELIGVLGILFDITDRKNVEVLRLETMKLENDLQRAKLEEQENFRGAVEQLVHDIRSPLSSMNMILEASNHLPNEVASSLRNIANAIDGIVNNLLTRYERPSSASDVDVNYTQLILIYLTLMNILDNKKSQCKDLPFKFFGDFDKKAYFCFISVNLTDFKQVISALLDKAIDSLDRKEGVISLNLSADEHSVKVSICDEGKGLSQDDLEKNYEQVKEILQRNNATLEIHTEEGVGTDVIINFSRVRKPDWIVDEIKLQKDDLVIVLDDDVCVHTAWESRFKGYNIELKYFVLAEEAIDFINNFPDKHKIFLLVDFELLEQELNGLHVLERTNITRAILVTSHYYNNTVLNLALERGVKILPKFLASEVPITGHK